MAQVNVIRGMEKVLANIAHRKKMFAVGVQRGLKIAGLKLQRESQLKVPVEFGVLKNSAFTRSEGKGLKTVVTVGYTAAYALFVHENVEMKGRGQPRASGKGNYWDPAGRGQAKFLEQPIRDLTPTIIKIVQENARIN